MTQTQAQKMVGKMVQDKLGSGIFGKLVEVKADGWAVVRGPYNRLDEVQVSRLEVDPT